MEERNPRKILFIVGVVVVVVVLLAATLMFKAPDAKKKGPKLSSSLTLWEVGLDTQAFGGVVSAFKAANPSAAGVNIDVKKFATYEEYARLLPVALANGDSPDIFVISNEGDARVLGQFTEELPGSVIAPEEFRKNFPTFFSDGLLSEQSVDVSVETATGTSRKKPAPEVRTEIASGVKGIPAGFETLGVFYNSRKMSGVPASWNGFRALSTSEDVDFVPLGLGLGRSIPGAADVFSLLLAQRGIQSYKNVSGGSRVLESWQNFANSPENNLATLQADMQNSRLSVLDMFVRGKVGAVIGYPSLMKDISLAAKRAGNAMSKIILQSVRVGAVPQNFNIVAPSFSSDSGTIDTLSGAADSAKESAESLGNSAEITAKKDVVAVNLVRYNYFALSKEASHADLAVEFLKFLATKPGQSALAKAYPQLLPAHRELLTELAKTPIGADWKIAKEAFLVENQDLISFDKGNPVAWNTALVPILDQTSGVATKLLSSFSTYISCIVDQDGGNYENSCSQE